MKVAAVFWIMRHPRVAVQEVPALLRQVPDFVRGRRIASTNDDAETMTFAHLVLEQARKQGDIPPNWDIQNAFTTRGTEAVLRIGQVGGSSKAVLKISSSADENRYLDAHRSAVQAMIADNRLDGWHNLLPRLLASGELRGRRYAFEEWVNGSELSGCLDEERCVKALLAIDQLHDATGGLVRVDEEMLASWFDPALKAIATVRKSTLERDANVQSLRSRLFDSLLGKEVWVSRTHGDYHPGNVLFDLESNEITGILDWDRSEATRPAFFDVAYLILSAHVHQTGARFGSAVADITAGAPLSPMAAKVLYHQSASFRGDSLHRSTLVLCAWLQHVGANLDDSERYGTHSLWVHRVVDVVVNGLAEHS